MPIMSMPSGSRATRAAVISLPTSIVPVVSTVTETVIGRSTPARAQARRAAMTAALAWSRSWQVSSWMPSMPSAIIASSCVS